MLALAAVRRGVAFLRSSFRYSRWASTEGESTPKSIRQATSSTPIALIASTCFRQLSGVPKRPLVS